MNGYAKQSDGIWWFWILRMQEATRRVTSLSRNVPDEWRRCPGSPSPPPWKADICLAPIGSELRKSAEVPR